MTIMNPRSPLNAAVPFAKRTDSVDFVGSDSLLHKLRLVGDWRIEWAGGHRGPFRLQISAPRIIEVSDERAGRLPGFRTSRAGWLRGSRRYGRLWRQGIPFLTLMENGINHPNKNGHQIFAESLISLFAGSSSI